MFGKFIFKSVFNMFYFITIVIVIIGVRILTMCTFFLFLLCRFHLSSNPFKFLIYLCALFLFLSSIFYYIFNNIPFLLPSNLSLLPYDVFLFCVLTFLTCVLMFLLWGLNEDYFFIRFLFLRVTVFLGH